MEMNNDSKRCNKKDRRIGKSSASFPLRDSHGILVATNRRVNADRRTEGLDVTESDLSKDVFNQYFEKYQNNG
jgi:hypothetical protein